jgi:hypothetical protein
VLLKMMPLLFLPIALFRGRWKTAVATLAVLAGTSWLYFQRLPADWRIFTDTNADPRPTWHAGNQGLMALLYAPSGEQARIYMLYRNLTIGLVGALLIWLTYCAWRGERGIQKAECGTPPFGFRTPHQGSALSLRCRQCWVPALLQGRVGAPLRAAPTASGPVHVLEVSL